MNVVPEELKVGKWALPETTVIYLRKTLPVC